MIRLYQNIYLCTNTWALKNLNKNFDILTSDSFYTNTGYHIA